MVTYPRSNLYNLYITSVWESWILGIKSVRGKQSGVWVFMDRIMSYMHCSDAENTYFQWNILFIVHVATNHEISNFLSTNFQNTGFTTADVNQNKWVDRYDWLSMNVSNFPTGLHLANGDIKPGMGANSNPVTMLDITRDVMFLSIDDFPFGTTKLFMRNINDIPLLNLGIITRRE